MMRDELGPLAAFAVVAEERSFTRAAKRLEVSPSALSHAMRRLEEQIGVRLLSRTTRTKNRQELLPRVPPKQAGDGRPPRDEGAAATVGRRPSVE